MTESTAADHLVEVHGWSRVLLRDVPGRQALAYHEAEHRNLTPSARDRRLSYHLTHEHRK